jgi:flagellin
MLSIQTNMASLSAQNALTATNNNLQQSMERLSTGFRINRAADDAAGLAISEKMQAQIGGLNQAVRNANDGASMIQTAEGALDQVQTMMTRMRNLAVQAASDTNGVDERKAINVEIQQLQTEIDNIANQTTFNGLGLLNGSLVTQPTTQNAATSTVAAGLGVGTAGAITAVDVSGAKASTTYTLSYDGSGATKLLSLKVAGVTVDQLDVTGVSVAYGATGTLDFAKAGITLTVANADSTPAALTGDDIGTSLAAVTGGATITTAAAVAKSVILQTGADATAANQTSVNMLDTRLATAVGGTSPAAMTGLATAIASFNTVALAGTATAADGRALITAVDVANNYISSQRAQLGAAQNQLGYAAASLTTTAQNVSAANSQIRDVDVAAETSNMSKSQILMQAGVSVLAQANQVSQLALKLLNG